MYKIIEEISGKKTCSFTRYLKSKIGDIILENEKILYRWAEYMSELFENHRNDYNIMKHNFAGPFTMKDEMRAAIRKMKVVKADQSVESYHQNPLRLIIM